MQMLHESNVCENTPESNGSSPLSRSTSQVACCAMIKLTRIDGEAFVLNAELIRYVENRPDTFVTLTTGERFIVKETMDQVVDRSIAYQQQKQMLPAASVGCRG